MTRGRLPGADRPAAGRVRRRGRHEPALLGPAHGARDRRRGRPARLPGAARGRVHASCPSSSRRAAWINLGDAYNTPVNWRRDDRAYCTLGPTGHGLARRQLRLHQAARQAPPFLDGAALARLRQPAGAAVPPRDRAVGRRLAVPRRGRVAQEEPDARGPLPAAAPAARGDLPARRQEDHGFRVAPPVGSVWEFANEKVDGARALLPLPGGAAARAASRPTAGPARRRRAGPVRGSGTTGVAALRLGCSFVGFEIDPEQVEAANERLAT